MSSMSSSTMIPFDHSILNSSSWGWKLCFKSCCLERLTLVIQPKGTRHLANRIWLSEVPICLLPKFHDWDAIIAQIKNSDSVSKTLLAFATEQTCMFW